MAKKINETGFGDDAELGGIYRWLELQSNDEPIHRLLVETKKAHDAKSQIHVSGTKRTKIQQLRRAVSLNLLKIDQVYQLLQSVEEHGRQRVYLFKPTGPVKQLLSDGTAVGTRLFGSAWGQDYFPTFEWPEERLVWADFRIGVDNRNRDWIIKIYGHTMVKTNFHSFPPELIDGTRWREERTFDMLPAYMCHVIRWRHQQSLLEVRIDKELCGSKAGIEERFDQVSAMVKPAMDLKNLPAFSLQDKCRELWLNRSNDEIPAYRIGHVQLVDSSNGRNSLHPEESDDSLDENSARSQAMNSFLEDGATPLESAVIWIFAGELANTFKMAELSTIIGGAKWNEISIGKRITKETYEHVFNRLCAS